MPDAIHVQYNNHTVKYVSHHLQTALFYSVIQHLEYPTIPVAHIHTDLSYTHQNPQLLRSLILPPPNQTR
jgi:hypothetical protein